MKSRTIDIQKCDGKPKRNTAAEDGTWVKTMVLIKPILRAKGPAKMLEIAPRRYEMAVTSPRVALEGWSYGKYDTDGKLISAESRY